MKFYILRDKLISLLESELEEMTEQQISGSDLFNKTLAEKIKKFTNKTENVEIYIALSLSNIYNIGSKNKISIGFEMKKGFDGEIFTLSDLTKNIESATCVDCSLMYEKTEWLFQIKRYPSKYLEFNENGILSYLNKLFNTKYGGMSNINLIILLQPEQEAAITSLNFKNIHESVMSMKKNISYGEVSFVFNANMKDIMLIRVFPEFKKAKTPLRLRSPKYQKLQNGWEEEMHKQKKQATS